MPGERISEAFMESYPAAADLSTHQYKAVKFTATGVDLCGAGERACGILTNTPLSGNAAAVLHEGLACAFVNGASVNIAAGDPLESAAGGILVKSTADKKNIVAHAVEAATADGVRISMILTGLFAGSV